MSSLLKLPCSNIAETNGLATRKIPAVAGIAMKTAPLIPLAIVLVSASKSFFAASELITGKIAVASDIPNTPKGNW